MARPLEEAPLPRRRVTYPSKRSSRAKTTSGIARASTPQEPVSFVDEDARASLGEPVERDVATFKLERLDSITFDGSGSWLAKGLLPLTGLAVLYGAPGTYKSFVALDLAISVALGSPWAGKKVLPRTVVYIAAEGASGLRKRIEAWRLTHGPVAADTPFYFIDASPNLGAGSNDANALIAAIEAATHKEVGLVVIDTLSRTLRDSEENGTGMVSFIANAGTISQRLECLCLAVHHTGKDGERGLRGHSSLNGAGDVVLKAAKCDGELASTIFVEKSKDGEDGLTFMARLTCVEIGVDEDGDAITSLAVESVEAAERGAKPPKAPRTSRQDRLLIECLTEAIDEAGKDIRPSQDGPRVRAAPEDAVRERYYARLGETFAPDKDPKSAAEQQRKAWGRAIKRLLDAKDVIQHQQNGGRWLWLP